MVDLPSAGAAVPVQGEEEGFIGTILLSGLLFLGVLAFFALVYRIPKFILRSVERGMESVLKRFIMVVILLGIVGLFVTLFYTSVAFWVVFTVLSFLTYLAATV